MTESLENFVSHFENFAGWHPSEQADYLTYFLVALEGRKSVTGRDLATCFSNLDLKEYKRISAYLSENAADRDGKYVKVNEGGYRLTRTRADAISKNYKDEPSQVAVSEQLVTLLHKIPEGNEKAFLREAVNCYRVEAFRGFIIMVWIVTVDRLQKHVFANKLTEFNAALAKNPDKKVRQIINYEDFSDLPESKFIELARSSSVITNDVRKLLDEKLGIRNSAAHPSGINIGGHKATEFAIDIIDNVLLKY